MSGASENVKINKILKIDITRYKTRAKVIMDPRRQNRKA